jgi:hypothetical protein
MRSSLCERLQDPLAGMQVPRVRDRLRTGGLPSIVKRLVRAVSAGPNRANRLGHIGNPAA